MATEVILVGAGGHSKVIADVILQCGDTVLGFLDDCADKKEQMGFPVLGPVCAWRQYADRAAFLVAIGSNHARKVLSEQMKVRWYTAIHPSASIAREVKIGEGTAIMAQAVVNPGTEIGKHCIVNSGAVVEHDNQIAEYVHISPNATLCGTVTIGTGTHIGAGATIKNNCSVCAGVVIGAGGVVVNNIEQPGTYVGVPVRRIK